MFSFLTYCFAANEGEIFPDLKNFYYTVYLSEIPRLKPEESRSYNAGKKYSLGLGSLFTIESISEKIGFLPELLLYAPSGINTSDEEKLFVFKPSSKYKESFLGGAVRLHFYFTQPLGNYFSFSLFSGPSLYYYYTKVFVNEDTNSSFHYIHGSVDAGLNVLFGVRNFKIGLKGEGSYFFKAESKKFSYSVGIVFWQIISPF